MTSKNRTNTGAEWRRTPWGWLAIVNGHRCTVRLYRAGVNLQGAVYVPRVDGTAASSPAPAYASLAVARRLAEDRAMNWPS